MAMIELYWYEDKIVTLTTVFWCPLVGGAHHRCEGLVLALVIVDSLFVVVYIDGFKSKWSQYHATFLAIFLSRHVHALTTPYTLTLP